MNNYVILSDSCCDLNKQLREEFNIDYVPMHYVYGGKDYYADLDWTEISVKEFYGAIRNGERITTAQVNSVQFEQAFTRYAKMGKDVLYISCSSALSASIRASEVARDKVLAIYPNVKISCVDSLNSCAGLGFMCITASQMRSEGKTLDEVVSWLEENKLNVHQECTVESLIYLKNAGRVSITSAFFGGLLNIKPIIISNAIGQNVSVEKCKGKKAVIERIAQRVKEQYVSSPIQKVFFAHADSESDLELLKNAVMPYIDENIPVYTGYVGPIVGASAGPGTIAVYFYGTTVTEK